MVLPFLGIRILYSLLSVVVNSGSLNIVSGNIVLKVILSVLPEIIISIILVISGVMSRHVHRQVIDRGLHTPLRPLVPRSSAEDSYHG